MQYYFNPKTRRPQRITGFDKIKNDSELYMYPRCKPMIIGLCILGLMAATFYYIIRYKL